MSSFRHLCAALILLFFSYGINNVLGLNFIKHFSKIRGESSSDGFLGIFLKSQAPRFSVAECVPRSQTWHSSRISSQRLVPPIHTVVQDGKLASFSAPLLYPGHYQALPTVPSEYLWIFSLPSPSPDYSMSLTSTVANSSQLALSLLLLNCDSPSPHCSLSNVGNNNNKQSNILH